MRRVVFVLGVFCVMGCQKKIEINRIRWSAHSKSSKPGIQKDLFGDVETTVRVFDEVVERSTQRIAGARVESSYLQKVLDSNRQVQFIDSQFKHFVDVNMEAEVKRQSALRFVAVESVSKSYLPLKEAIHVFEPELVISEQHGVPELYFKIEYIPADGGAVFSLRVNKNYSIESIQNVQHCFQESRSLVFPEGPRLSALVEMLLGPLLGDGSLTSLRFFVGSDDGTKVNSENGNFLFEPQDPRFDQVQAFFYTQKMLSYAEEHWKVTLPFKLNVSLRAGYPQMTNTAYYYRGMIRLGDGDGIGYKMIPRDPSIVSHEVAHALIDSLTGMGTEGETASINEAFADYLTASMWDNPQLGHTAFLKRAYTRTLEVATGFADRNGGLYHDSGILSGSLWDIQKRIGPEKTQMLALKTMIRLGSLALFKDVRLAMMDAMTAAAFTTGNVDDVVAVLDSRGWP